MNYKYSIIVPIYGVEQYLDQCLESIINQKYRNIEIILVDDGSKDTCPEICDKYAEKDNRIIVIHKQSGGLVSARKAGAQKATGDYVCCVDGDDYISEEYINQFNNAVVNNNEPDIVCCGYYITTNNKKIPTYVNARAGVYTKEEIASEIFPNLIQNDRGKFFLPTVWGKAIKSDLYKKYQMIVSDKISMGEDGACTIPCIVNAESICILNSCDYFYRYNETSMTKEKKPLKWDGQIEIAKHLEKTINLNEYDFKNQWYRRVERGFFSVALTQFNMDAPYQIIIKNIEMQYDNELFNMSIKQAKFKFSKMLIADWLLKRKIFIGIYFINKIA